MIWRGKEGDLAQGANYPQSQHPTPMSGYAKLPLPACGEGLGVGFSGFCG